MDTTSPLSHPPLVIPPHSGQHAQTVVFLHGRGHSASGFGHEMMEIAIEMDPGGVKQTLGALLPRTKFVFPWGRKERSAAYRRARVCQWFEAEHFSQDRPPTIAEESTEREGLHNTVERIRSIVKEEVDELGDAGKVLLAGMSQGGASTLICGFLSSWEGIQLGGLICLSGWLPYWRRLLLDSAENEVEEWNPFSEAENGLATEVRNAQSPQDRAFRFLQDELELPSQEPTTQRAVLPPIFMAHGTDDNKVPVWVARESRECLLNLVVCEHGLSYAEFPGLGHRDLAPMLSEMVNFIQRFTQDR